jgi:hypothetical protein
LPAVARVVTCNFITTYSLSTQYPPNSLMNNRQHCENVSVVPAYNLLNIKVKLYLTNNQSAMKDLKRLVVYLLFFNIIIHNKAISQKQKNDFVKGADIG